MTASTCAPTARCPTRQVAQVMGALNAGGFASIGLVTDVGGPALDGARRTARGAHDRGL